MAEQEAKETQAEEAQHTTFAVLAELSKAKATLERFEESLNFPATFPGAFDDLGGAWHGRDDESSFLGFAFFGRQPHPTSPRVIPREDRATQSSGRTS